MNQCERIVRYLLTGKKMNWVDGFKMFQSNKLASRVSDLNSLGFVINSTIIKVPSGKWVAEYNIPSTLKQRNRHMLKVIYGNREKNEQLF